MKNIRKIIALCCFFFFVMTTINAQNYYIRLTDASGINTDPYQVELEAAAKDLVLAMPKEVQDSFKVFDLGSYLLQEKTDSAYIGFFNLAKKKAATLSKYYILIGKKSSTEGVFTDFEVDLVLPTTGRYVCADNSDPNWRKNLKSRLKMILDNSDKGLKFEKAIIKALVEARPFLINVNCTKPLGDLRVGFEAYRGKTNAIRENSDEKFITFTSGAYYYNLEFRLPVSLNLENTYIEYNGNQYIPLFNMYTQKIVGLYKYDDTFKLLKTNPDGTYKTSDLVNIISLVEYNGSNNADWQFKRGAWGKFDEKTDFVKSKLYKFNHELESKKVYELLRLLDLYPLVQSVNETNILIDLGNFYNVCGLRYISSKTFETVDPVCLDFLIGYLKDNLESEGLKKKEFIDWLYSKDVKNNKDEETQKFGLLSKPEIFNSFTAEERLKTLFYIARYTDFTSSSTVDIPNELEDVANKLLKYMPIGQVDFVTNALKAEPVTVTLPDNHTLVPNHSILEALDKGIDNNHLIGGQWYVQDNYDKFIVIMKDLIMKRTDVQFRFQEYKKLETLRTVHWKASDSRKTVGMPYLGLIETYQSKYDKGLIQFSRKTKIIKKGVKGISVGIGGAGYSYTVPTEDVIDSLISTINLDPYDYVGVISDEFVASDTAEVFTYHFAFSLHHLVTKDASAKVVYKCQIAVAAIVTLAVSAEIVGLVTTVEEVYAYQWFFHSVALTNGIGNIEISALKLNGNDIPPVLEEFVTISNIFLASGFGMAKSGANYGPAVKGTTLTKEGYSTFRKYIQQADLIAERVKQAITEAKLTQVLTQEMKNSALAAYARIIRLKDYAKAYLFRLKSIEHPFLRKIALDFKALHKYSLGHIPPAQYEEFIAAFQNAPDNVLSLFNKDASFLEEWNLITTTAEREVFINALKNSFNNTHNPGWTGVLDIENKVLAKAGHVIDNIDLNASGTAYTGNHSEIGLKNYVTSHPSATYEFRDISFDLNSGVNNNFQVFEAKAIISDGGIEIGKANNGGVSSFFPKAWNRQKILDEVEFAINNNHGRYLLSTSPNEYFGFSRNGKVRIHFYLRADGVIGSYFPKKL